jgi:hypothetical protein
MRRAQESSGREKAWGYPDREGSYHMQLEERNSQGGRGAGKGGQAKGKGGEKGMKGGKGHIEGQGKGAALERNQMVSGREDMGMGQGQDAKQAQAGRLTQIELAENKLRKEQKELEKRKKEVEEKEKQMEAREKQERAKKAEDAEAVMSEWGQNER